ncbi:phosphate ABC transporter membrane protein 1, PhoT family [Pyrobaculum islandicum DSM 4184]|uniref:Phosphate transport system permease protein n=1 Tax=Pyrobaculum islandicum (strain DSM 4184 / JCM 9189 / GEO3) TaxID=384616 RepID=A1RUQ0_PYRIL|nr:phosphate ABC transporter permease subunit PstC [Pyrobaculum islandicum]ABL88682.1 phosphate ABC transporter membrane protein 1, PhoT family [Pyrobaculum islandicum DSM 4184]
MLGFILAVLVLPYLAAALALLFIKMRWGLRMFGISALVAVALLIAMFLVYAYPILEREGLAVFTSTVWDPAREEYGVLPALVGTLITSAIAISLAFPMAVGVAVTINEVLPPRLRPLFASLVDLTATMPTVLYGLWGIFALGPLLQSAVNAVFGPGAMPSQYSLLTAGILLAVMVTPYAAAVIREGYAAVPKAVEEAVYALGATRLETVLVKLRHIRNYVVGGVFLALGRAMGETVAVAMVVGGKLGSLPASLFDGGITISSLIALQFPNAAAYKYMTAALFAGALALAVLGIAINAAALYLIRRWQ